MPNEPIETASADVEKTSKLKRIGNAVTIVGIYGIPTGVSVAYSVYCFKILKMNHETARLNLVAAQAAAAASQQS